MTRRRKLPQQQRSTRRGAAAVEFALCLPILVLVVFAAIEASNAIHLKQSLTVAAYETARIASAHGGTQADAEVRCQEILTARGIKNAQLVIAPPITAATVPGTRIFVTVKAPANANSISPQWYYKDSQLESRVVMDRN